MVLQSSLLALLSLSHAVRIDLSSECSCGAQLSQGCVEEGRFRPCCVAWARDCPAHTPLFRQRLSHDCNFEPYQRGLYPDEYQVEQKCKNLECSNVFGVLGLAHSELKLVRNMITGKSNSKWNKKCGCGDFNPVTQMCQAGKGSRERPCCSLLADCKASDPWPTMYASLNKQASIIQHLSKVCVQSCKLKYQELCLDDMKELVEENGENLTREEVFQAGIQKELAKRFKERPGDHARRLEDYHRFIDSKFQEEKNHRVERIHQRIQADAVKSPTLQLVDLTSWVATSGVNSCCMCTRSHPFGDVSLGTSITDFCHSSNCPEQCEKTDSSFCGRAPKNC